MQKELIKKLITDFPTYLAYVYKYIGLPEPTNTQKRIAEILNENPSRLILEAFRGVGKSWITAIYVSWRLLRDKNEKVLVVSASGSKAIEISRFIRRLFDEVPILNHLTPKEDNRDSVLSFDVAGCEVSISPSVKAVGITSQITGSRATLVLLDDVEVPSNSMTEMMRDKLIARVKEVEALLIPDKPSSVIILGTPQSLDSIYNKLNYRTVIIPAQVPDNIDVYEGKLDDWVLLQGKAGDAIDERFPIEILNERRAYYGEAGYKLQFMLDTTLSDEEKYPLKLKDLMVLDCNIDTAPISITHSYDSQYVIKDLPNIGFTGDRYMRPSFVNKIYEGYDTKVMSIDVSGRGADETAYTILGVKNGIAYIIDCDSVDGYDNKSLTELALIAKKYKVNDIVIEKNFGDGMFRALFEPIVSKIYPCTITDIHSKRRKELRIIETIEPITTNNKLVINRNLIEKEINKLQSNINYSQYSLLYQYTHISRERGSLVHDDKLDSLEMALSFVKHMLLVNPEDVLQQIEEERKEKEIDELLDKLHGVYKPKRFKFSLF